MRIYCIVALLLCGCGGGGDDKAQISSDTAFQLNRISSTEIGELFDIDLIGSDNEGYEYTGSLKIVNRENVMVDGVLATRRESILIYAYTSEPDLFDSVTGNFYFDENGYLLLTETEGVTCAPDLLDKLPDSAKDGDFGALSDIRCNDGTSEVRTWWADANGSNLDIVYNTEVLDSAGNTEIITTEVLTINQSGELLNYKQTLLISDTGYILTIESR